MVTGSLKSAEPHAIASVSLQAAVQLLLLDYVEILDQDRLEEWPELFVEEGLYRVISRENAALNLPAPIMYYYSRGMMRDRVTALRDALTYEYVHPCHIVSTPRIVAQSEDAAEASSNFAIFHSTEEGESRLYCVGSYRDTLVMKGGVARFVSRIVTLDTSSVPNLIALPL